MSAKFFTLIAGASLGLLVSAAACSVETVDDDSSDGGSGATGGNGTGAQGGAGVGGMNVGGEGTGATGGAAACITCEAVVSATMDVDTSELCGTYEENGELLCEAGTSCELFVNMYVEACGDGTNAGSCESQCADSLCAASPSLPDFGNAQDTCATCIEATPSYNDCVGDV